jgi:hypothetical protein
MDTTLAEAPGVGVAVARIAVTTADRLAAFRLRYEGYIAEQGKAYPEADHDERLLSDELDPEGDVIVVESGSRIIGTVQSGAARQNIKNQRIFRDGPREHRSRYYDPPQWHVFRMFHRWLTV